ncbi:hypothetical protein ACMFMF_007742 [Clarireedia jacksonii]
MSQPEVQLWKPTFGVEFEFVIAAICDPRQPKIDPDDQRQVYFDTIDEDFLDKSPGAQTAHRTIANHFTIQRHIRAVLRQGGFATGDGDNGDIDVWEVVGDASIRTQLGGEYQYFGIEVRTPAFYYESDALLAIRGVCSLLKSQFRVSVNKSCGLHVHVGNCAGDGFTLPHLRRIVAFLHAFEPQLDTVHPSHRLRNIYCDSFRGGTKYSYLQELTNMACDGSGTSLAYSLDRIQDAVRYVSLRPFATIEFRQHEATLEFEEVDMWIHTVIGIIAWLHHASDNEVGALLSIAEQENWAAEGEKGGLHDADMMLRLGPAFADREFTFTDLLKSMNLSGPADYYKDKLHCHTWLGHCTLLDSDCNGNNDGDGVGSVDKKNKEDKKSTLPSTVRRCKSDQGVCSPSSRVKRSNSANECPNATLADSQDTTDETERGEYSFDREFPEVIGLGEEQSSSPTYVGSQMPIIFSTPDSLPPPPTNNSAGPQKPHTKPPVSEPIRSPSWTVDEEAIVSGSSDNDDNDDDNLYTSPPPLRRRSSSITSEDLNLLPSSAHSWTSPSDPRPLPRDLVINPRSPQHRHRLHNIPRAPDHDLNFWTKERTPIRNPILTQAPAYGTMNPHREVYPGPERQRPRPDRIFEVMIHALQQALLQDALDTSPTPEASEAPLPREEALEQLLAGHGAEWAGLHEGIKRGIRHGAGVQRLQDWRFGARVEWDGGERSVEKRLREWEEKEDAAWRECVRAAENQARARTARQGGRWGDHDWEPVREVQGVRDPFAGGKRLQHPVSPDVRLLCEWFPWGREPPPGEPFA